MGTCVCRSIRLWQYAHRCPVPEPVLTRTTPARFSMDAGGGGSTLEIQLGVSTFAKPARLLKPGPDHNGDGRAGPIGGCDGFMSDLSGRH